MAKIDNRRIESWLCASRFQYFGVRHRIAAHFEESGDISDNFQENIQSQGIEARKPKPQVPGFVQEIAENDNKFHHKVV